MRDIQNNIRNARQIVRRCVEKSIVQFEELWQKYFHVFDKHQQLQRYVSKAIAKTKTYSKLENMYWGSIYSYRDAGNILPTLAKYDPTPNKKYRRKYKDMLFAQIAKNKAVYTQYSHIEILDEGIKQLIVDDELHYMKSLYQFIYGYDTTALKTAITAKMPVEKQALGYALLALSFANNKTYLQNFSRLNLQKDSLLYKIYKCIAYNYKKDIDNTFQQHMSQINQNPFYLYIFQILRQRRSQ